jgi:WW domain
VSGCWFADAAAGQATPSSVHSGSEAWVVDGMTTPQPIVWIELIDNDDNVYYYNTVTGESSWDKPSEMCLGGAYGTSGPTTSEVWQLTAVVFLAIIHLPCVSDRTLKTVRS